MSEKKTDSLKRQAENISEVTNGGTNPQQTMFPEDYRFNLSDFALFLSVMKVKKAYEDVLSIILDERNLSLKEVKVEQVILNDSGKRAIRLDAWAADVKERQFGMEMQNDSSHDSIRKRSRFYQSMIDTPLLKSGQETRYKHLPSTTIIFITQDDIFKKDLAMYTFTQQCEEVPGLRLEDGTGKIFLNMTSRKGRPELVSLLQYMRNTAIDNPDIIVKDERILDLDKIVNEVREGEEWEGVKMNIYEIGITCGEKLGEERGIKIGLERANRLAKRLIDEGRMEDWERSTSDEGYREELLREYGI